MEGGGDGHKNLESSKSFLFIYVIGNFMIIIGITILLLWFSSSSDLLYFLSLLLQLMLILLIFLAVIYDIIIIIIDLEIITFTIIII